MPVVRAAVVATAAALASSAAVASCGQDFDRQAAVDSFADANTEATDDQAACVVDELLDRYDLDELREELEAERIDAGFEETQFRAMFRCGLEGDVEAQITEQLTDAGVADADAPCVSAELVSGLTDDDIDVLLSGEITDEFSTKFLEAMDACGALNP